jgi:hypothetical protein
MWRFCANGAREIEERATAACCTCSRYGRVDDLLAAVLKIGWRIVNATLAERALLDAHGFGNGRVQ